MSKDQDSIGALLAARRDEVLSAWITAQLAASTMRNDLRSESELRAESAQLLDAFVTALSEDRDGDVGAPAWAPVRQLLEELSRVRALDGYSPSETATFVFSLKQPLFDLLRRERSAEQSVGDVWQTSTTNDRRGQLTVEA